MFQTLNLVCDNSTLANFKSWAQAISAWFATAGWVKSSDTGQVNWATIASVPGSNAYVYEIWEPNDGLTNFFLKVEYGNNGSANSPAIRLSIGTATDGAGGLTGTVMGPYNVAIQGITPPSTSLLYPCYFSGSAGRFSIMMWRGAPNNVVQVFAVERSITTANAYTGDHVTLMAAGNSDSLSARCYYTQQTLVFSAGVAPACSLANRNNPNGGLPCRLFFPNTNNNAAFDGFLGMDTVAPYIGYWDTALTSFGLGNVENYTEGQVFSVTLYGATRTYVASFNNNSAPLNQIGPNCTNGFLLMRYD